MVFLLITALLTAGDFVLGTSVVYADTDTEAETGLRLAALQGLVRLAQGEVGVPSEVVNSLKNSLINDPNPQVRGAATKGLGDLEIKEAIPDLQKRIDGMVDVGNTEERNEEVIKEIKGAIAKLGGEAPNTTKSLEALETSQIVALDINDDGIADIQGYSGINIIPILIERLPNDNVAFHKLVAIKINALPYLVEALKSQDLFRRADAINALVELGIPGTAPEVLQRLVGALEASLKSQDPLLRSGAVVVLFYLSRTGVLKTGRISEELQRLLIELLADSDPNIADNVIRIIVSFDKEMVGPLIEVLKQGTPYARKRAAEALGEIRDSSATDSLILALGDRDWNVAEEALKALVKIGPPAVGPLKIALDHEDVFIRRRATRALGTMGGVEVLVLLLEKALMDSDMLVRQEASKVLSRINDPKILDRFVQELGNSDTAIRQAAVEALGNMGKPAVGSLMNELGSGNNTIRVLAARGLGKIKDSSTIDGVARALLKDEFFAVRLEAAWTLGKIGDAKAVPVLIESLQNDPHFQVRSAAAWALGKIGNSDSIMALISALEDENQEVRDESLKALLGLGKSTLETLSAQLGHQNSQVREMAEKGLTVVVGDIQLKQILAGQRSKGNPFAEFLIQKLELRESMRQELLQKFGIEVEDKFPLEGIAVIKTVLENLQGNGLLSLMSGLKKIIYLPTRKEGSVQAGDLIGLRDLYVVIFLHEIGHLVDKRDFGGNAFLTLYNRSSFREDFAHDYGRTNHKEDFASTIEKYAEDTKREFLRAIQQAREGKPVYLEKLLFILDVFTGAYGSGSTVVLYRTVSNEEIRTKRIAVGRDQKKLTAIGGIAIYQVDGTYNLDGLQQFSSEL